MLNEQQTDEAAEGQKWNENDSDSSTTLFEGRSYVADERLSDTSTAASRQVDSVVSKTAPTQSCLSQMSAENSNIALAPEFDQLADLGHLGSEEAQGAQASDLGRPLIGSIGIEVSRQSSSEAQAPKSGAGKKSKRRLSPESYLCAHCGTRVSPEWRKGPDGPKTLCNACGCRLINLRAHAVVADCSSALGKTD